MARCGSDDEDCDMRFAVCYASDGVACAELDGRRICHDSGASAFLPNGGAAPGSAIRPRRDASWSSDGSCRQSTSRLVEASRTVTMRLRRVCAGTTRSVLRIHLAKLEAFRFLG